MDLGVFGIEDVGWFGDILVDGKWDRLVHNLPTLPDQG